MKLKPTVLILAAIFFAGTASAATEQRAQTALDKRLALEGESFRNAFSLTPHRQNYILPFTYNTSPNNDAFAPVGKQFGRTEMKFQFSFKTLLKQNLFGGRGDLFFAYTHLAFWQAYDAKNSAPFRETNYEPELLYRIVHRQDPADNTFRHRLTTIAFNHQSNGKSGAVSRSWNRVYASFVFEKPRFLDLGDFYLELKPWLRIPENENEDDNPSMEKYLGYGELRAVLHTRGLKFSLMGRNNLRARNLGAVQLDCSFPLEWLNPLNWFSATRKAPDGQKGKLRGYLQYFNGYGESLIDYDHAVQRIGVGVILIDWL